VNALRRPLETAPVRSGQRGTSDTASPDWPVSPQLRDEGTGPEVIR
jgi:hypothetical protein